MRSRISFVRKAIARAGRRAQPTFAISQITQTPPATSFSGGNGSADSLSARMDVQIVAECGFMLAGEGLRFAREGKANRMAAWVGLCIQ
ncbi:hypothetical protein C8R44DRAFT_783739 [Mycena epipterygia]|nr:hypothetical protein C8R44DRAFT_783739 [Mycena epipterygia]